jgi:hypothetical protein
LYDVAFGRPFGCLIGDDQSIAARRQRMFKPADDGREDWIGDVGNDDSDQLRATAAQARGNCMGPIAEPLRSLEHTADDRFAEPVAARWIERARNRGRVDPHLARHILDRRHRRHDFRLYSPPLTRAIDCIRVCAIDCTTGCAVCPPWAL